ncbi:hypothetical protein ACP4OV_010724 [Aristida adscensionis]
MAAGSSPPEVPAARSNPEVRCPNRCIGPLHFIYVEECKKRSMEAGPSPSPRPLASVAAGGSWRWAPGRSNSPKDQDPLLLDQLEC